MARPRDLAYGDPATGYRSLEGTPVVKQSGVVTTLSPLDQIRQAEADMARQIAAAREEAERTLAEANTRAKQFIEDARQAGREQGQAQYREIVARAEKEAQAILADARDRAESLGRQGSQKMEIAVSQAVNIVLGTHEGETAHEH